MQSENPLLADIVKLMNSAAGTFAGVTREARDGAREKFKEAFGGLDFVTREEFDAVKDMAAKAREQAEALQTRVAALESQLATLASAQASAQASANASGQAAKPARAGPADREPPAI